MAIFYLDLIAGNNANDGLSAGAPKLGLTNATALVTSVNDEIRVRGTDSLYTNLTGNWTWTNGSNNVTNSGGNYTGETAAGDYICKTTSGVPQLFLVASRSYNAGTTTTTIVLTNTTNCTYRGVTETVPTSKLVMSAVIALQTLGRNGQTSGTAASWTRVDTKISGGWDAAYTAQTSYTLIRNTANAGNYSVLSNEATQRLYWDFQRFIILNSNQNFTIFGTYSHYSDCALISVSTKREIINSYNYSVFNNCYLYHASTAYDLTNGAMYNKFVNCTIHNSINRITFNSVTQSHFYNCSINEGNSNLLSGGNNIVFTGSTFNFHGATAINASNTNTYKSCTFNFGTTAANFSTANTWEDNTYTQTGNGALSITGTFTENHPNVFNNGSGAVTLSTTAAMSGNSVYSTTGAISLTSTSTVKSMVISGTTGAVTLAGNSPTYEDVQIIRTSGAVNINHAVFDGTGLSITTTGTITLTNTTSSSNFNFTGTTGTIAFISPIVQSAHLSGSTYTVTHNSTTAVESFIGNVVKATTSVTFNNENTPVANQQPLVSGNTWTNGKLTTAKGIFIDNTGLDFAAANAKLYPETIIYDGNAEFTKTLWTGFADSATVPQIYQPNYSIPIISPSGNTLLFDGGFIDLTTDVYTGKTNYSGTTALRLYNTLNSATDSVFRTVDFQVQAGATGYTTFWVKGGSYYNINYNLMVDGKLVYSTWKSISTNARYEYKKLIIANTDLIETGTATLWFRFPSLAAGANIIVDNISINTDVPPAMPTSGLTAHWKFDSDLTDSISGFTMTVSGSYSYSTAVVDSGFTGTNGNGIYSTDTTLLDKFMGTNNYTFGGWVKCEDYTISSTEAVSFFNLDKSSQIGSEKLGFGFNTGMFYVVNRTAFPIITNSFINNKWYHFAHSFDGTYTRHYVNGNMVAEVSNSISLSTADLNRVSILNLYSQGANDIYFDDVFLYNRAISTAELLQIIKRQNKNI